MIVDGIGLTIDSFEAIYTTGGTEVLEIYAGLNYTDLVYSSDMTIVGCPPLLFTANGRPLKDYTILGNSYQDGVPDPDNPVEVQSVGERTNNLFDKAHFTFSDSTTIVYVPIYVGEGSFTLSTDLPASASGTRDVFFIGGNVSSGANSSTNGVDAAMPRTRSSVDGYITVATRYNTSRKNPADYHYMINAGSEALPYEGYYKIPVIVSDGTNSQTANIYLDEPLRRIGDYADEIDFKAGTVTRRIKEVVLTGAENDWKQYLKSYYRPFTGIRTYVRFVVAKCNYFEYLVPISLDVPLHQFSQGASENLLFNYDNGGHLSAFKAWLSQLYANGNPVIVYHVLSTPTTEPITLHTVATLNGTNTLSINTTLPPSQLSITGHVKPSSSYGNLTDVNGTYIKDKDGVQIKVTG